MRRRRQEHIRRSPPASDAASGTATIELVRSRMDTYAACAIPQRGPVLTSFVPARISSARGPALAQVMSSRAGFTDEEWARFGARPARLSVFAPHRLRASRRTHVPLVTAAAARDREREHQTRR